MSTAENITETELAAALANVNLAEYPGCAEKAGALFAHTLSRREPDLPVPAGIWGRVEMPGYRENEGWISEETRFGLQVAVVRDREGTETAAIGMGPLCRVVWLHPAQPEPLAALPPGRPVDGGLDEDDIWSGDDD